jgi:hypothetical protein
VTVKRTVLAIAAGLLVWILVISLLNRGLRLGLAGYAAAEPAMSFTLTMMAARLIIAALASLIGGAAVGWIAPRARAAPLVLGAILVAVFVPVHVQLWSRFPPWYHLTFLLSLLPLVVLGARLAGSAASAASRGEVIRP